MLNLADYLSANMLAPELITLLEAMQNACSAIGKRLRRGAIDGSLCLQASENSQGEQQTAADIFANNILKEFLLASGVVRALASEEEARVVVGEAGAPYLVAFDPLDGSSNVNVNGSLGTIFSVLESERHLPTYAAEQFFQKGRAQVCAGYVLYGPSTQLVLAVAGEVCLFTLDDECGDFLLTQLNIKIPSPSQQFALNMSNLENLAPTESQYIGDLVKGKCGLRNQNYTMRWSGAMVADVHRTLLQGGVFLYPTLYVQGVPKYKLRLLYEASPMAYIIEAAGGRAVAELWDILDILPRSLHQKMPVVMGSKHEVECYLET